MIVAVAAGLDEGRAHGYERMSAYFHHMYRVLESAAKDAEHDLTWSFPMLGIEDPDAQQREAGWSAAEATALATWHKERHMMEQVRVSYRQREGLGKGAGGPGQHPPGLAPGGEQGGLHAEMRALIRNELRGKGAEKGKERRPQAEGKGAAGRGGGGAGAQSA